MSIFIARDFHHFLPNRSSISYKDYVSLDRGREASFIQSWRGGHYTWLLEDRIRKHFTISKKVYVGLGEPGMMHEDLNNRWCSTVDFVNRFSKNDPVEFFCNMVPLVPTNRPIHYINDMFFYGHKLYSEDNTCRGLLSQLKKNNNILEKHWDCLLGEKNFKKDFIYQSIKNDSILSKTILSYYGDDPSTGIWNKIMGQPRAHSAESYNKLIRYSDLIDPNIYNNSYYTAVVETVTHDHFAMFSEKEAKPIMAERPFVIFGSHDHLKAFRTLGFKTFAPVINEDYDSEKDQNKRFKMVIESMKELSDKDPHEVLKQLKSVLEHNRNHFLNFNWNQELIDAREEYQ